jgi:Xaa-Pro aminopeptidase
MFQSFEDSRTDQNNAKRIPALRKAMRAMGLDGFIVPREDEFQGEYVPAAHDRLNWLTGFGGSAGTAIIMARKAALFVDGRYILQAPDQVDTKRLDIVPVMQTSPQQWLADTMKANQTIGIDPRLHSQTAMEAYQRKVKQAGGRLFFTDTNLVDAIWQDRPALPETPVISQPFKLTGVASVEKRKAIAATLKASGADRLLITQPENIAWLLNIRADDVPHTPFALSFGVLHKTGAFDWYIDAKRVSSQIKAHIGKALRLKPAATLQADLKALRGQKTALDPTTTPAWFVAQLKASDILRLDDPCALTKACKTKAEISASIAAHKTDGVALCQFLHWFDQHAPSGKLTEIDAAKSAEAFRMASGKLKDLSFDTISGAGPNGAIVHYRVTHATNRRLRAGELYLIDSGGQYVQGTTDVTRTLWVAGKPPAKDAVDAFTRVLRGHIGLAMVRFPKGTNGMQLDTLARAPLWAQGQDFDHGTGHGVGSYLSVHEGPQRISKGGMVALQEGMIVSNEPGFYAAGRFGIRIENLQYVTPAKANKSPGTSQRPMHGFVPLTLAPIDRNLIDRGQLTADETEWLDAYHQKVWKEIGPKLKADAAKWLKKACAPL